MIPNILLSELTCALTDHGTIQSGAAHFVDLTTGGLTFILPDHMFEDGEITEDEICSYKDWEQDAIRTYLEHNLVDEVMSLAFRIRGLEPWEELNDSDVYAVRMGDGSQMYVVTMGYGGESFDVQLYDGPASFQLYLTLAKADNLPSFEVLEAQNWADYYAIMYLDPEDGVVAPEQYTYVGQWAEAHGCLQTFV